MRPEPLTNYSAAGIHSPPHPATAMLTLALREKSFAASVSPGAAARASDQPNLGYLNGPTSRQVAG
jgi:hypothetical protein